VDANSEGPGLASRPSLNSALKRWRRLMCGGPAGDLGAGVESQLIKDVQDMRFGGALGDDQPGGNLPVTQSLGDQCRDLLLPPR